MDQEIISQMFSAKLEKSQVRITKIWIISHTIANFACVIFIQTVATAIVLGIDDCSCDKPIREWLIVEASMFGFNIVFFGALKLCKKFNNIFCKNMCPAMCYFIMTTLISIALMIAGSVWEFTSDDCYDNFQNGWNLALAVLIVGYLKYSTGIFYSLCYLPYYMHKNAEKMEKQKEDHGKAREEIENVLRDANKEIGNVLDEFDKEMKDKI